MDRASHDFGSRGSICHGAQISGASSHDDDNTQEDTTHVDVRESELDDWNFTPWIINILKSLLITSWRGSWRASWTSP